MVNAQWPADAQVYYQQGNAAPGQGSATAEPLRSATAQPSNSKAHASTAHPNNSKAHASSSNSRPPGSSFALDADLEPPQEATHDLEGVMWLFDGIIGPSEAGQASHVPAASMVDYAKQQYGIIADSEADAQRALEQVAAAQQSGDSIKAANAEGARLLQQDAFTQQQATSNKEAALACQDAIDLLDDSEEQAVAAVSASVSPQMQQLAPDEQYAREMGRDEQEQQDARYARGLQEDIQDMHVGGCCAQG